MFQALLSEEKNTPVFALRMNVIRHEAQLTIAPLPGLCFLRQVSR